VGSHVGLRRGTGLRGCARGADVGIQSSGSLGKRGHQARARKDSGHFHIGYVERLLTSSIPVLFSRAAHRSRAGHRSGAPQRADCLSAPRRTHIDSANPVGTALTLARWEIGRRLCLLPVFGFFDCRCAQSGNIAARRWNFLQTSSNEISMSRPSAMSFATAWRGIPPRPRPAVFIASRRTP